MVARRRERQRQLARPLASGRVLFTCMCNRAMYNSIYLLSRINKLLHVQEFRTRNPKHRGTFVRTYAVPIVILF